MVFLWRLPLSSRFYLGGPTSVRGFSMHSVGPQSEGLLFLTIPPNNTTKQHRQTTPPKRNQAHASFLKSCVCLKYHDNGRSCFTAGELALTHRLAHGRCGRIFVGRTIEKRENTSKQKIRDNGLWSQASCLNPRVFILELCFVYMLLSNLFLPPSLNNIW